MPLMPESSTAPSPHTHDSSYRESLLEHLFTGAVMRHLWQGSYTRLEVLKPQVDNSGYDLVMEANGVVRHIQLKTSHIGAKTAKVKVGLTLGGKPSGCVIWIRFDDATLDLGPFLWLGGVPGSPLPPIEQYPVAVAPKGNALGVKAKLPHMRAVPKSAFTVLITIDEVVERLFGPLPYLDAGLVSIPDMTLGSDSEVVVAVASPTMPAATSHPGDRRSGCPSR